MIKLIIGLSRSAVWVAGIVTAYDHVHVGDVAVAVIVKGCWKCTSAPKSDNDRKEGKEYSLVPV